MTRNFTRRHLLRGAGSIAIGLPFLEEFMPIAKAEADDGTPCRLFTMSFGLGIERAMQLEQFSGPLQPLAPFAEKAAMFTSVDGGPLSASGTPHFSTSAATFTGVPQQGDGGNYQAGGPSMEQVMKRALHPAGVPNVAVPEISALGWEVLWENAKSPSLRRSKTRYALTAPSEAGQSRVAVVAPGVR